MNVYFCGFQYLTLVKWSTYTAGVTVL